MLASVGTEVDTLMVGQRGGAQDTDGKEAWRTGDTRVGKLCKGYSVWVGGTGNHVDLALWEEAWDMELKHTPLFTCLSAGGQEYWQYQQD